MPAGAASRYALGAGGVGAVRPAPAASLISASRYPAGFDFGDAARMVAEFAPILGGGRPRRAARARTRTRTRTRTRMFARFCLHVSLFALLVLACSPALMMC